MSSSLFEQLCRCAGFEHVDLRVGSGYVLLRYRGLTWYEWLIDPLELELDLLRLDLDAWGETAGQPN